MQQIMKRQKNGTVNYWAWSLILMYRDIPSFALVIINRSWVSLTAALLLPVQPQPPVVQLPTGMWMIYKQHWINCFPWVQPSTSPSRITAVAPNVLLLHPWLIPSETYLVL